MLSLIVVPALAAAALTQAPAGVTQSARIGERAVESADSVRIVRSARSAQSSFEAFRRLRLPRQSSAHGPCDVTIGRYCYWRGDDVDDLPPPAEAREIRERRAQLLVHLDSAIRVLPGDGWLLGQRIRYLAEMPDSTRPRSPSMECRADASWCHALDGYLAHVSGSYAAANVAFERALAAMDEPTRCRWMDISSIIDGDLAKRYESLDCPARERMARRLFALGAPFYMIATTDLFTEHMSRLTRARMAEGAATTYGDGWADDARELVLRYGWPTWYSQRDQSPSIGSEGRPLITGHDSGRPYFLLPSLRTIEHHGATTTYDWRLDDRSAPSGYAPAVTRSIHFLPHQVARFRHGDSTIIVAAWDASRDTSIGRQSEAAVAITNDEAIVSVVVIPVASRTGRAGSATVAIRADSGMVSIEVLDREERRAARARVGYAPPAPGRMRLSDLLIYRPWTSDLPLSADSTLADHAVRGDEVRGRDAVAVYWETYGLPASSEPVQFALSVEQIGVGWARRAAERLRLTDPTSGVRVEWTEVPVLQGDRAGRGVRVDLSRLRPGRYQMQLSAKGREGAGATAVRELVVR